MIRPASSRFMYYFSCDCDLCVIPMKIYIYKLIKEFSFFEDLHSTLRDKISLNILFNNLSNIFFSIVIIYTFFDYIIF